MIRKTYTPEQIINKLQEVEVFINQGATTMEASRKIGITEQTYYRWRREYGGMRMALPGSKKIYPDFNPGPGETFSPSWIKRRQSI